MGQSSAAEAVLDMNCVSTPQARKSTLNSTYGLGLPPSARMHRFARMEPAPVEAIALASDSAPANRKMVDQSMA